MSAAVDTRAYVRLLQATQDTTETDRHIEVLSRHGNGDNGGGTWW